MILQTSVTELTFGIMDLVYIGGLLVTIASGWFTIKNNSKRIGVVEKDVAGFKKSIWEKINEQNQKLTDIELKIETSKSEILSKLTELISKK